MSGRVIRIKVLICSLCFLCTVFDEHVGDALYSKLHNPFAKLLVSPSSPAEWASYVASNLTSSPSSPPTSLNGLTTFLAELPGLDTLPRDNIVRQSLSLYVITYIGEPISLDEGCDWH